MDWWVPVLRGVIALLVALLVYLAARRRFAHREDDHAPTDMGLD